LLLLLLLLMMMMLLSQLHLLLLLLSKRMQMLLLLLQQRSLLLLHEKIRIRVLRALGQQLLELEQLLHRPFRSVEVEGKDLEIFAGNFVGVVKRNRDQN
jgi:hypothetical protein